MDPRTRTIAPDVEIPLLGFGTYLIPDAEAAAAVRTALEAGYRHIDTAEFYQNEQGVGTGLREAMRAHGLAREQVFVTTKLFPGNAAWGQTPKTTETTITSLEASLAKLGLDHVDLYLIHAPFQKTERIAQWRGLVELQRRGMARAIGVSNFNQRHIEELVEAGLPLPAANQIELHPWSQKPALVRFLDDKGITPIAYSSLVPLSTWRTAPGHASGKTDAMRDEGTRADSPFKQMAAKYGVSESRLLLRWAVQQRWPVLPKSTKKERIIDNANLFSFTLDDADMKAIALLDRGDGVAWGANDPTHNP
jgi:2,5-diketo-D-gluconate reductase A